MSEKDSSAVKQTVTKKDSIQKSDKIALYSRTAAISTNRGLVGPFTSMIAITLGANSGLIGWIQSISNLLATFLSPVFGRISDLVQRRIPFVIISTLFWGLPYAFLYFITPKTTWVIVIIVASVNLLLSLGVPTFSALQNELFPEHVRAKFTGRIFWFDAIGSMITTIFTGIILTSIFGDQDYQKYILIPVAIGFVLSIIGIMPFKNMKEPLQRVTNEEKTKVKSLKESFKTAFSNKSFTKFTIIAMVQSFFMSFAWPLFSIFQVNVLDGKAIQIAILAISFNVTTLLVINFGAKLSDRFGRTKLIFFNRFVLTFFPLAYIFAKYMWHLYVIHFILSAIMFVGNASFQAYLLDIVPPEEGGMYFGIYTMITGIFLFLGSLISGYLTEFFERFLNKSNINLLINNSMSVNSLIDSTIIENHLLQNIVVLDTLRLAVIISLSIAAFGRFSTSFLFLSLKEMKKFPSSWNLVWKNLMNRRRMEPPI